MAQWLVSASVSHPVSFLHYTNLRSYSPIFNIMSLMNTLLKQRSPQGISTPISRDASPIAHCTTCGLYRLNFDIIYYIASILDASTMQIWRKTCPCAEHAVLAVLNARYDGLLSKYVSKPAEFRAVLHMPKAVVSGSAALHILDVDGRGAWEPKDIDVYTPIGMSMRFVKYLEGEGFRVAQCQSSSESYQDDYAGFKTVVHAVKGTLTVDVIQSTTLSALHPLPYFWSTHVMNFLTADSFCIAYPAFTLQGLGLTNPIALDDRRYPRQRTLDVMAKYKARSYDFRLHPHAWEADVHAKCRQAEGCPLSIRWFGDRFCLMGSLIAVDMTLDGTASLLPDNTRTVRWWRGGDACGGQCLHTKPSRFHGAVGK
ncbi:hypothetical protein OH77DRAFT_232328 [Trametes cingulata]|nr:hypothetical protein OH77DRAFT_232328 [Trametes cingulata]